VIAATIHGTITKEISLAIIKQEIVNEKDFTEAISLLREAWATVDYWGHRCSLSERIRIMLEKHGGLSPNYWGDNKSDGM